MRYINGVGYEDMEHAAEVRDLARRFGNLFSSGERKALEGRLDDLPRAGGRTGDYEEAMAKLHGLSPEYSPSDVARALSMFLRNQQN